MKLTPLDIRKQEFSKQLRGLDDEQVHSFLEMVADEYEAVVAENQEMQKRVSTLEVKIREYQQIEENLQQALMNAQKAGREAEQDSVKRSEIVVQNAQLEADRVMHEARKKHQQLLDDIHRLEGQRRSFLLKMKQILRGQVELLEILEEEALEDSKTLPKNNSSDAVESSAQE